MGNCMYTISEVISFSEGASEKSCSRATLYRAVDDGRLNDVEVGGRRMLVKDQAWEEFEPRLKGRRVHKLEQEDDTSK